MHGYGIGQRIAQISGDELKVEEGSLYPGLYRLERRGWIESEWDVSENNQRAKFYKLTRSGRKQLIIEEQNWERACGRHHEGATRELRELETNVPGQSHCPDFFTPGNIPIEIADEVESELRFHVQMRTQANIDGRNDAR